MKSKDAVNNFLKSAGSKAGCKLRSIEENSELSSGGSSSQPTVRAMAPSPRQRSLSSMSTTSPSMGSSFSKRTSRASSDLPSLGNRKDFCLVLSEKLRFTEYLCLFVYLMDSFCYKHLLLYSQNNTINTKVRMNFNSHKDLKKKTVLVLVCFKASYLRPED